MRPSPSRSDLTQVCGRRSPHPGARTLPFPGLGSSSSLYDDARRIRREASRAPDQPLDGPHTGPGSRLQTGPRPAPNGRHDAGTGHGPTRRLHPTRWHRHETTDQPGTEREPSGRERRTAARRAAVRLFRRGRGNPSPRVRAMCVRAPILRGGRVRTSCERAARLRSRRRPRAGATCGPHGATSAGASPMVPRERHRRAPVHRTGPEPGPPRPAAFPDPRAPVPGLPSGPAVVEPMARWGALLARGRRGPGSLACRP